MMRQLKGFHYFAGLLLTLSLLLSCATQNKSTQQWALGDEFSTTFSPRFLDANRLPSSESLPLRFTQITEAEVFKHLERDAQRSFEMLKPQIKAAISQSQWNKMVRAVLESFSKVVAFKKIATTFAKQAGLTLVVAEIVTSFIIPPILVALHQPGLAAALVAIPLGSMIAGGKVFITQKWDRYQISRQTGVSLSELDAIRSELLDFEHKNHLMSIAVEKLDSDTSQILDARIVKSIKDLERADNQIEVSTLVDIVKKSGPDGNAYLYEIASHRGKPHLYTTELLTFIQDQPELLHELMSLMKASVTSQNDPSLLVLKKSNFKVAELNAELNHIAEDFKTSYKKAKQFLESDEKATLNKYLKELTYISNQQFKAMQMAEYNLLATYKLDPTNTQLREGAEFLLTEIISELETRAKINRAVANYIKQVAAQEISGIPRIFDFEASLLKRSPKLSPCTEWAVGFL